MENKIVVYNWRNPVEVKNGNRMKKSEIFDENGKIKTKYVEDDSEIKDLISWAKQNGFGPWDQHDVPHEHEYVEIGGRKWATMNIGANSIVDAGLYFQWGDTIGYSDEQVGWDDGKKSFSISDYKFAGMTKYNSSDDLVTLELIDDAVNAAWGGNWRMPTIEEFHILLEAANVEFVDDYHESGVSGFICTDKSDSTKELFFPVSGEVSEGFIDEHEDGGCFYWSRTVSSDSDFQHACGFEFLQNTDTHDDNVSRFVGRRIRGILDE